jgi:hypothetical protein
MPNSVPLFFNLLWLLRLVDWATEAVALVLLSLFFLPPFPSSASFCLFYIVFCGHHLRVLFLFCGYPTSATRQTALRFINTRFLDFIDSVPFLFFLFNGFI